MEIYICFGIYSRKLFLFYIFGLDVVGVIEVVGDNVFVFKKGDRVFISSMIFGGYVEYVFVVDYIVYKLFEKLDFK